MSKLRRIEDYFTKNTSNDKKYDIKRYFYLSWSNKYKPDIEAIWTKEKPDKINFIEHVNCDYIKKGYYFYICGYFSDYEDRKYYIGKEKKYKNVSYLISHLQKNIRKQDDILAVSSCYHLLKLDLIKLLRRLPIIMLEDTFLNESFTTLIWLMIAVNFESFKIKQYIYEWILGISYVLCKINEKDELNNIDYKDSKCKDNIIEILDKYSSFNTIEYSLLYSMHLRIAYGGTDEDINMLKKFINLWYNRFLLGTYTLSNIKNRPISIFVKELDIIDWDLSAIDYHCNSNILEYVLKKYNYLDLDNNELKKIIWINSSSINNRIENKIYNESIWNIIKDYLYKTQKYLLDSS